MEKEEKTNERKCTPRTHAKCPNSAMGGGYGIAFLGAAVYFVQHSDGFWAGVLGVLKAMIWPAFLIHKIFTILGM